VRKAAAWADANTEISRSTPLVNIVDEFASRLFAELDYIKVHIFGFVCTSILEVIAKWCRPIYGLRDADETKHLS